MHLNVTLASAVWTLSGLIGAYYSATILPHYVRTYRASKKIKDAAASQMAGDLTLEDVVTEANRFIIHVVTVAIGVASFFVTPQPPPENQSTVNLVFGLAVLFVIILTNILTTVNTIYSRRAYLRRRGAATVRQSVSRNQMANMLMGARRAERESRRINKRIDEVEEQADIAHIRADVAHARADVTDVEQGEQNEHIEILEHTVEVKQVTKTRREGDRDT